MKKMKREDFIEWSIQASLDCEQMEREAKMKMDQEQTKFTKEDFDSWKEKASKLGILSDRAKELAADCGIKVDDGWYDVSNIIPGTVWVGEEAFLKIIKSRICE